MARVFISYSRRDKPAAEFMATALRRRGADVFIDYQKLVAGENFIGRLGHEIQACDSFVLLLSPPAVASKWVQAEAAWALHCDKPIIPVEFEPASLTTFFFLINKEKIDFTHWSVDRQVADAIHKLTQALGLPESATRVELPPQVLLVNPSIEAQADNPDDGNDPAFTVDDLADLYSNALEVTDADPEQAIFLYQRILDVDPNYRQGQVRELMQAEEVRLKPQRLERMKVQAEIAAQQGEWRQAAYNG
ncbi:MAG: toll/interleukin-1 receptor domain-containing protein [Anaerolineae bacterium]|nr:toll/interleukin-1 receptor domain-containing protein [Anaerolineae bacterium]